MTSLRFMGVWSQLRAYCAGDVVFWLGEVWVTTDETLVGSEPSSTEGGQFWIQLVTATP